MTRLSCSRVRLVGCLLALGWLGCVPALVHAQNSGLTRQQVRQMEDQAMRDREFALYHIGDIKTEQKQPVRDIAPQLREDFRQLQLVNNNMMQQMVSAPTLDYKMLNRALSEINRRAGRLKDNLVLLQVPDPKEADAPPVPTDERQVKASLFKLDSLIMSFVHNPQFKEAGVVAMPHADKAGHDLREIIELSRAVKRALDRLSKDATSTP